MMLQPKAKAKHTSNALEVLTANMVALQLQAKMFHLNVTGPRFYGDHKTYDGIYEVADEWFDILAERMRALNKKVCSCPAWVMTHSLISEGAADENSEAEMMVSCMAGSLEILSSFINRNLDGFDETTISIVQDLDAELGKQLYFVRSSI